MRLRSGRTISETQTNQSKKVYEFPKDKIHIKHNIQKLLDVIECNKKNMKHDSDYYVVQSKHVVEVFTLIKNNFDIFNNYPIFINITGNRAVYLLRDLSCVMNKGISINGNPVLDNFNEEQKAQVKSAIKYLIEYVKFLSSQKMLKIK